jgi:hypothetical protein
MHRRYANGAEAEAAAPLRLSHRVSGDRRRHGRPNVTSPDAQGIFADTRAVVPSSIPPYD